MKNINKTKKQTKQIRNKMSLQINCSKRSKTRYNGYKGRRNNNNNTLFAFVKAEQPSCEGFTQVRRRNTRRKQFRPKKTFMATVTQVKGDYNVNRFNALDNQDDTPVLRVNVPNVVKPKAPIGVWGKKPKKVSFAQDNVDTLMKPTPTKVKEFNKEDAPNTINAKVQKYPEEEEYLKLKRSKNAWKPKVRSTPTSVTITNDWALKKLIEKQNKAPIINWADAVSSDEESDEEEMGNFKLLIKMTHN